MTTYMTFDEREVVEDAADRWWVFLLTGIGWLVFALLVFQWDYTTVYAISFLFGAVALFAAMNEFIAITVSTTGWKIGHGILGALFVIAGIWALVHPHNAFATLAALIGFFLLFKGIFDLMVAFVTQSLSSSSGGSSSCSASSRSCSRSGSPGTSDRRRSFSSPTSASSRSRAGSQS